MKIGSHIFFKQCDTVSDKEMQSLWSRVLSGEATNPGAFSKRTVDFISSIDKKDAAVFTALCQFVWVIGDPSPLVYDAKNEIYTKHGIDFSTLKHLDSIGLISFEAVGGYRRTGYGKYAQAYYYGTFTAIEFGGDANNEIETGNVLFTNIGKELVSICGSAKNQEFYYYVIKTWFDKGLVLSSIRTEG